MRLIAPATPEPPDEDGIITQIDAMSSDDFFTTDDSGHDAFYYLMQQVTSGYGDDQEDGRAQ